MNEFINLDINNIDKEHICCYVHTLGKKGDQALQYPDDVHSGDCHQPHLSYISSSEVRQLEALHGRSDGVLAQDILEYLQDCIHRISSTLYRYV